MSTIVFIAVLCAAVLHTGWNALLKNGSDKHLSMCAVVFGHVPIALVLIGFVPLPNFASLPYLMVGILLHQGYQIFLLNAYRFGDLSQVYPIARGSAPLIVAAVSVLWLGEVLTGMELLAVLIIGAGILSLGLVRHSAGQRNINAAGLALGTGCFIAGYSLIDGLGARVLGSALGYYAWLSIGNGILFAAFTGWKDPGILARVWTEGRGMMIIGGGASFVAYALVIWAFMQAPIALVTALRETSIVFALLIGVVIFKEPLNLAKVFSTMMTLLGAALLRFSKS